MRARSFLLVATLVGACSSSEKAEPVAARGSAVLTSAPGATIQPASHAKPGKGPKSYQGQAAAKDAAGRSAVDAGAGAQEIVEPVELKNEEREVNPYSESVTLKLTVTPSVKAVVLWGARQMAHLEPGNMDAEIARPRGSGPLDLEIRAEGYLPYHTRLYADRNDKTSVRLYRAEDAPNLFGYKRSAEAK